jgi:hypothetical protein
MLGLAGEANSCCGRDGVKSQNVESQMSKYSLDQLKRKLGDKGWQNHTGKPGRPIQGTLGEMVETAHGRRKYGYSAGTIKEIETEIEVDMLQLEELWQHMGLPTI